MVCLTYHSTTSFYFFPLTLFSTHKEHHLTTRTSSACSVLAHGGNGPVPKWARSTWLAAHEGLEPRQRDKGGQEGKGKKRDKPHVDIKRSYQNTQQHKPQELKYTGHDIKHVYNDTDHRDTSLLPHTRALMHMARRQACKGHAPSSSHHHAHLWHTMDSLVLASSTL